MGILPSGAGFILFFIFYYIQSAFVQIIIGISFTLTVILLLLNKNKFVYEDKPLSIFQKLLLVSIALVATLLNLGYFGYGYYKAFHPDYGYEEVENKVNFHIYRPTYLPDNYEQRFKFITRDNYHRCDGTAVQYNYSHPLKIRSREQESIGTTVVQCRVGFYPNLDNLNNYVEEWDTDKIFNEINEIKINKWPGASSLLLKSTYYDPKLSQIELVTPEKMRISISSNMSTPEELVKIIESME